MTALGFERGMEQFGLGSLEDLPNLREIEELLDDPHFNKEKAQLLMEEGLHEPAPEAPREEAPHDEPPLDEAPGEDLQPERAHAPGANGAAGR